MLVWYVLSGKTEKITRNGGTAMKRRLVLYILILVSAMVPGTAQAKNTFGRILRTLSFTPDPIKAVDNIVRERFMVDSVTITLDNESPEFITTSCVYRIPKFFDPMAKNPVVMRTKTFKIGMLPDEQVRIKVPVVFDHVKQAWFPEKVLWGTGLRGKKPGKRIVVNLQRNLVTAAFSQIIDVTPPGARTYTSSVWHPLSRQTSRLDVYNTWTDSVRVSTNIVKGYDIKTSHREDRLGNEYFERRITPTMKPIGETLGEAGIATFNLPPGKHTIVFLRQRPNGTWHRLGDKIVIARGDGNIVGNDGKQLFGPLLVPHPGETVSSSAIQIK